MQPDGEAAVGFSSTSSYVPSIPDLDRAGAVLARRDLALEVAYVERMVLDVDGEVRSPGSSGTPFGTAQLASAPSRSSRKS